MAKRSGPSISVKMILTSTLLILVIVGGFGVLNWLKTGEQVKKANTEKIEEFRKGLESRGRAAAQLFANNVYFPLLNGENRPDTHELVKKAAQQDPDLKLIYVLTRGKRVIDYCRVTRSTDPGAELCEAGGYAFPPAKCVEDIGQPECEAYLEKYGAMLPPVDKQEVSWNKAQTTLEERAKSTDAAAEALVAFDSDDETVRFFAAPVHRETQVSARAVTADPPDSNLQGFVVLGYSLQPIRDYAEAADKAVKEASTKSAVYTGAFGALFVLIGAVLAIFQGLQISKPIKMLAWKADQIARGDLEARVEVTSTDEIGLLGENFNFMADQLVVLLHQTAEKAHLEKELEVARTIQDTLVPPNDPVDCGFFKLAGYFQPATQCGGDWWTWHPLKDGKVLIVIGDVTGHGVPSAMITATAKAACDVARTMYREDVAVTTLLEIMNDAIYQSARRKFVMTCFASIVDPRTRTITYANAGHNFPYLFRQSDQRGEFGSLMIRGNRLGDIKESKYEAKQTELLPGDILVWYTDGIVECENETGEEFGEKRFRSAIRRAGALDAGEIRDNVISEAMSFYGQAARKDDITFVIGRVT